MYCVKENNKDKGGLDSSFVWLQSRDSDSRDWWVKEYRDVLIYMSVYGCLLPLLPPSLHSCCQGTGVALIFLPLVRYVETQANPQTCVLFFVSPFAFSHALSWEHRLTCLSSQLSIKGRKVEQFSAFVPLRLWRAQKVTVLKHSASSLQILPSLVDHLWCTPSLDSQNTSERLLVWESLKIYLLVLLM